MYINAIIMAAGLSRRMKQDKLKMKINDKFIYEYIFETIGGCEECFNKVIVVAKDEDILSKSLKFGFKPIKNNISHMGQSSSIKLGVMNSDLVDGYMFFVADQPMIKIETIKELIKMFEKNPKNIVMACHKQIPGNPVVFPYILKEELMNLNGDTGGKAVIKNNKDKLIKVNIQSENEFIDIDTIDDYENVVRKVNG